MNGPVLVGWDASDHARDALELGLLLAAAMETGLVVAAVAVDRFGVLGRATGPETLLRHAEERLEHVPRGGPLALTTRPVVSSSVGRGLHDLAEELGARAIVLGSTRRGALGRIFLGTVAGDLLNGAPCPVAVAPRGYDGRYANRFLRIIAVAFDTSPESRHAVAVAAELARAVGATLRVMAVLEPFPSGTAAGAWALPPELLVAEEDHLRDELEQMVAELDHGARVEGSVLKGRAADALAAESEQGIDLLVAGSRGYGPLGRTLLGSVSAELVRAAACPVLVVPRGAQAGD